MKLGISHQRPDMLTPARFDYLGQLGVEAMEIRLDQDDADFATLDEITGRVRDAGLDVHEIMLDDLYSASSFTIGSEQRDRDIERFCRFVTDLGRLGIRHTTYAWHTGGAYQTGTTTTRNTPTREFRTVAAEALPNAYDETYDDAHMWDTYAYFMQQVLPVARAANVKLQLHPNDPPLNHQGVARIFRSTESFARAFDMVDDDVHSSVLFCVGTWSEMSGSDGKGEDIIAAIRTFAPHITQVHFRNTSSPLPDFHETFPDNGYVDLVAVMRALVEIDFDGIVVPDHVPGTYDGSAPGRIEEAYTFGYIRALMQAAST